MLVNRVDRDEHIKVLFENIRPGLESQFRKGEFVNDGERQTPYDYLSVMHYGKSAFAKVRHKSKAICTNR